MYMNVNLETAVVVKEFVVNGISIVIAHGDMGEHVRSKAVAGELVDGRKLIFIDHSTVKNFNEDMLDFLILHETGHIVNGDVMSSYSYFGNELEADKYAIENGASIGAAIMFLEEGYSMVDRSKWTLSQRLMGWVEEKTRISQLRKLSHASQL